ncbi:MAG: hypothetical protein H7320_24410 [Ferruginibacter sp.]|nr:hypothetical protein [Ferruginibacter sp.]
MPYRIIFFFFMLVAFKANANTIINTQSINYSVVVSFGSMCCGTASDDFLKNFVKQFNTKNKVVISAMQVGGCGREGEYKILFSLEKLKEAKKIKFVTALKKLIPEQNEKNKTVKASSGPVTLDYNLPFNKLENCRGQLTKWQPAQ